MAKSTIGGLIAEGYPADLICAAGPRESSLTQVAEQFGINTTTDNQRAAAAAEVVVLAVKPQMLKSVAQDLRPALDHKPLLISVAAGITTESMAAWLGGEQAIIRSMPNTPSMVKTGATGLYANCHTGDAK